MKLIIALQEMKNADIRAKTNLSHEVIWSTSSADFLGSSENHKNSWIVATDNQNEIAELRKWTGNFFNSYAKIREVEGYGIKKTIREREEFQPKY